MGRHPTTSIFLSFESGSHASRRIRPLRSRSGWRLHAYSTLLAICRPRSEGAEGSGSHGGSHDVHETWPPTRRTTCAIGRPSPTTVALLRMARTSTTYTMPSPGLGAEQTTSSCARRGIPTSTTGRDKDLRPTGSNRWASPPKPTPEIGPRASAPHAIEPRSRERGSSGPPAQPTTVTAAKVVRFLCEPRSTSTEPVARVGVE